MKILIGGLNYDFYIVKDIGKCSVCANNLANMSKYPQKHLEMPQIPKAVLTIDTIGYLPVTSKGNRWTFTAIRLHTSSSSFVESMLKPRLSFTKLSLGFSLHSTSVVTTPTDSR